MGACVQTASAHARLHVVTIVTAIHTFAVLQQQRRRTGQTVTFLGARAGATCRMARMTMPIIVVFGCKEHRENIWVNLFTYIIHKCTRKKVKRYKSLISNVFELDWLWACGVGGGCWWVGSYYGKNDKLLCCVCLLLQQRSRTSAVKHFPLWLALNGWNITAALCAAPHIVFIFALYICSSVCIYIWKSRYTRHTRPHRAALAGNYLG